MSDDFLFHRKPEYSAISVFSRAIYKIMPLSGGLRYADRVNDEWEKDLWDFNDRMTRIFLGDESRVMPRRNMLGEKIDRKNGWLFGLGGSTGLWSTPFAMTKWKNATIANFFEGRDYKLKAFIEMMIENKTSLLYRHPKGKKETKWLFFTSQKGYDFQQNQILQWIHKAERQAYFLMIKEFPQIKSSAISNAEQIQKGYQEAETALQILTQ